MNIASLFKNCLSVKEENGYYTPVRFTDKQLEFYKNYNDMTHDRSNCAAGVIMEFYTDADEISFKSRHSHFCRKFVTFDIYENGDMKYSETFHDSPEIVSITYKTVTKGRKKITVYLPFSAQCDLYDLNLGNFEPVSETRSLKYLAYGDSITQNMTTDYSALAYPSIIADFFNMQLLNQGIGTFRYCRDSLDKGLDYKPDLITVAYGTNDMGQIADDEEIAKNAREYLSELKTIFPDAKIFVISPIWRQTRIVDNEAEYERFIKHPQTIEEICNELSLNFVNGLHLVPNIGDFYVDGLHPNSKGFMIYALKLIKILKEHF